MGAWGRCGGTPQQQEGHPCNYIAISSPAAGDDPAIMAKTGSRQHRRSSVRDKGDPPDGTLEGDNNGGGDARRGGLGEEGRSTTVAGVAAAESATAADKKNCGVGGAPSNDIEDRLSAASSIDSVSCQLSWCRRGCCRRSNSNRSKSIGASRSAAATEFVEFHEMAGDARRLTGPSSTRTRIIRNGFVRAGIGKTRRMSEGLLSLAPFFSAVGVVSFQF